MACYLNHKSATGQLQIVFHPNSVVLISLSLSMEMFKGKNVSTSAGWDASLPQGLWER